MDEQEQRAWDRVAKIAVRPIDLLGRPLERQASEESQALATALLSLHRMIFAKGAPLPLFPHDHQVISGLGNGKTGPALPLPEAPPTTEPSTMEASWAAQGLANTLLAMQPSSQLDQLDTESGPAALLSTCADVMERTASALREAIVALDVAPTRSTSLSPESPPSDASTSAQSPSMYLTYTKRIEQLRKVNKETVHFYWLKILDALTERWDDETFADFVYRLLGFSGLN